MFGVENTTAVAYGVVKPGYNANGGMLNYSPLSEMNELQHRIKTFQKIGEEVRYDPELCARYCSDWSKCGCKVSSVLSLWGDNISAGLPDGVATPAKTIIDRIVRRTPQDGIPVLQGVLGGINGRSASNNGGRGGVGGGDGGGGGAGAGTDGDVLRSALAVRCAFFSRNLLSRMPLVPTPSEEVCGQ
jgi:hypothetical protein